MLFSEMILWVFDHVWALFSHVTSQSSFPKTLTAEEERMLIARVQEGDDSARQKLIEHNLRLVAHIAKKYSHSSIDPDDLVSIGSIGLIKAVRSFKPECGKLATYAARCIENRIRFTLKDMPAGGGCQARRALR